MLKTYQLHVPLPTYKWRPKSLVQSNVELHWKQLQGWTR